MGASTSTSVTTEPGTCTTQSPAAMPTASSASRKRGWSQPDDGASRDGPLVAAQLDRERARPADRPQPPAVASEIVAALLRHHHAERVGALREPERRGVARAEVRELLAVGRERQVHGEAR